MFCVVELCVVMVDLVVWVVLGLCGWFASLAFCCWLLTACAWVCVGIVAWGWCLCCVLVSL